MYPIKIGTRTSPLALWQAHWVAARLQAAGFETEIVGFQTSGDKIQSVTLSKVGSKGIFTQELEEALLDGRIHIAVHSAKDMPSHLPDGLELIAYTEREISADVVVSFDADFRLEHDTVARIGTSSTRRKALLARYYPHCQPLEARGNLQTRLRKLEEGQFDALILAYAGVHRIGRGDLIRQHLPLDPFTPPVGQGSLAIEVCTGLEVSMQEAIRKALNHADTETCLLAERAYLHEMNGGCSIPTFALAHLVEGGVYLQAGIISLDGKYEIRLAAESNEPDKLGAKLAYLVLEAGGRDILEDIRGTGIVNT